MTESVKFTQKCNYYELLGLKKEASLTDIKKAYYNLAFLHHPDKNLENKEESAKHFQKINQAYQVLSNSEQRDLYNFLGAEDYNVFKNQNSNFQNFFNSAFKIKTSFESSSKSTFVEQTKNVLFSGFSHCPSQLQKAFNDLFEEEDSSSDEEEEEESNVNVFSFSNHYTMYCNFQHKAASSPKHQPSEPVKTIPKGHETGKKGLPDDESKKIKEKVQRKEKIFNVLRNQIRKKKKISASKC